MNVKMGKYILKSDSQNLWITEQREVKNDGKPTGKFTTARVAGYCSTVPQLLNSFLHHKIRDSEANDLRELLEDIKQIEIDLEMMIDKGVLKNE